MNYLRFNSHKESSRLTVWECLHCGQTFALGDDKEVLEDGSTKVTNLIYSIEPLYCPLCGKPLSEGSINMVVNVSKELWENVAKDFSLELGEEFHLRETQDTTYRFTDKGLEDFINGVWAETSSDILSDVLHERLTIVRIPWKPKENDKFYFIGLGGSPRVISDIWKEYPVDLNRYKYYNCFKTEKDAQEKLDKILEVLRDA